MKKLLLGTLLVLPVCGNVFGADRSLSPAQAKAIKQAVAGAEGVHSPKTVALLQATYPELFHAAVASTIPSAEKPLNAKQRKALRLREERRLKHEARTKATQAISAAIHTSAALTGALCDCADCWPDGDVCLDMPSVEAAEEQMHPVDLSAWGVLKSEIRAAWAGWKMKQNHYFPRR